MNDEKKYDPVIEGVRAAELDAFIKLIGKTFKLLRKDNGLDETLNEADMQKVHFLAKFFADGLNQERLDYHRHEALHMCLFLGEAVESQLMNNAYIQSRKKHLDMAGNANEILLELYQS